MPKGKKSKKSKKNKNRGNASESPATPSTPSVDDDTQLLLPSGACGFSESRESRRSESAKVGKQRSDSKKRSPNQSESPSKKNLAVPEKGSDATGPSTSPKKGPFSRMVEKFSPKRKSPNRSINSECICEDKNIHEAECPELMRLQTEDKSPKEKSSKRPNEPKETSFNTIVLSKEDLKCSGSSNPNVKECSINAPHCDYSPERRNLTVPDQEKRASSNSPSKRNLLPKFWSSKKKSPDHSSVGSECRCMDKRNHRPECVERRNSGKDKPSKSSHSEMSSNDKSPNKINVASRSPRECDSEETSRDPKRGRRKKGRWHNHVMGLYKFLGYSAGKHSEEAVPLIEITDCRDSGEKEAIILGLPTARRRPKSFEGKFFLRPRTTSKPPNRDQLTKELRDWNETNSKRNPEVPRPDPDKDRESARRLEKSTPIPSASRNQSTSPQPIWKCNCGSDYCHKFYCSREIEARRRRKLRRCRQDISRRL